jgi:hypothetical protein
MGLCAIGNFNIHSSPYDNYREYPTVVVGN